ncbi:hypothetical protein OCV73_08295 [Barnesiella propionica]|uniref:tetratricopeptide repeat protein n=1 Tax=Barnesiella propionica TaxID=2981781 RepID=UPI0011CC4A13|nr:tetratricopeptide repeat protein [Barnesiella propionica]MCU6768941.1 hypothetical protein [Barnesiella propionica]
MNKKLCLPLLLLFVLAFVGCKEMGPMSADYFTVTPSPLEVVGGQVPATITGKFPEKYFDKKATVTVTPYLVYAAGETAGTPFVYQGEKVQGNNQTISYKMGGVISMPVSFTYIPEMRKSDLYLGFTVKKGKKTIELPRVKVAEGVISTSEIADAQELTPAITPDKFQRIIKETFKTDILFLIQQANLRASELNSSKVKDFHKDLIAANEAPNKEITNVNISSYASPDGGVELNTKLAEKRETNTTAYLEKQMKKDKVVANTTAEFTAQDWEGFQELVSKSNIQDKDLILRVLSMYPDPEQREREIKNMSSTFKVLAEEILPQLRYSRLTASIDVIGKSDEEIAKLAKEDAKSLTVDELLYAATLTKNNNEKAAIYTKVTEIYPNDYRGYNNLGMIQYENGDLNAAAANFAKAAKIAPNAPEIALNQGLISLNNKDYAKAERAFGSAAGVNEVNDALGVYYLKKGDYNAAVKAFGSSKTNNAALAQILTKDYSAAKNTLAGISTPNATTYYLLAVLGARTNNEQMVTSNLKQSIKLDPSKAAQAASDLEFAKYSIDSIVK